MEEIPVPLHSWFWLIIPMMTVMVLSVLNYLRSREAKSDSAGTDDKGGRP